MSVPSRDLNFAVSSEGEIEDSEDFAILYYGEGQASFDKGRGVFRITFDTPGEYGETRVPLEKMPLVPDLAMLVRRMANAIKKVYPDSQLAIRAEEYIDRNGLGGSILR